MNTPPARQTESYAVIWQEELMGGGVSGPPGHRLLPDGFSPIAKLRGDGLRYDGVNAQELVIVARLRPVRHFHRAQRGRCHNTVWFENGYLNPAC